MNFSSKVRAVALATLALGVSACAVHERDAFTRHVMDTAVLPYAAAKRSKNIAFRANNHMKAPLPEPESGILIARGSFLSSLASWTVVDLKAATITRALTLTKRDSNDSSYFIVDQAARSLTVQELNNITLQANAIWNPRPKPHTPLLQPTDVTCDVLLFDHGFFLHDWGMACPDEGLVTVIDSSATRALKGLP